MSLINQVINQLEQRGAEGIEDLVLVRPASRSVQPRKIYFFMLVLLVLAVVMGALLWKWKQKHTTSEMQKPIPIAQPVAAVPVAPVVVESAVAATVAEAAPVFQLSFELGSVDLPKVPVEAEQPPAVTTKPHRTAPASKPATTASVAHPVDSLPMKQVSPKQQSEAEFRKAVLLMQQGRIGDALAGYQAALNLDAGNDQARQAMVQLLIENKRSADAERVLQEAIRTRPEKVSFAMMEARLQVERGAIGDGVATLEKSLPFAGQQADYQAFLAALLQRQERHKEAVEHYQIALQQLPNNGLWLMGTGISLQALERNAEAKEAFKRALDTQTLRPDLQAYVQQKLKGL